MSAAHEGPGHGEATLSLTEAKTDGTRIIQSWTICDCTLPALRQRFGPPEWESVADEDTTRRIGEATLQQAGNVVYGAGNSADEKPDVATGATPAQIRAWASKQLALGVPLDEVRPWVTAQLALWQERAAAPAEAEWSPAEAGAAVAAALDQAGPGPWSPPDSLAAAGAEVFHSPFCKCGHKKTLHAGANADGRCASRSCGCGKYKLRGAAR